jgi:tripartite-type tricarboxylate transporter receptor subunit TctC
MNKVQSVLAALMLLGTIGATPVARAQTWPTKPIKLIAVFPAGGSVDQVARVLAQQLSEQTGQPVVVDNRGGASGSIGTAALAKA